MTLYLTDATTAEDIVEAAAADFVHGVKLYPAGATTNSSAGVNNLESLCLKSWRVTTYRCWYTVK